MAGPSLSRSRAIKVAGAVLAAGSLAMVVAGVLEHWPTVRQWRPDGPGLGAVVTAALLYGLALVAAAEAWHRLLAYWSGRPGDRRAVWHAYCVTQIGKYLPGNVFHFIGRHGWVRALGYDDAAIVATTASELLLMLTAAGTVALVVLLAFPLPQGGALWDLLASDAIPFGPLPWLAGLAVLAGAVLMARRFRVGPGDVGSLATAFGLLLVLFAVMGLAFVAVVWAVGGSGAPALAGVAVLAWIVGFAVPGAPGGIGVRELVLVATVQPSEGAAVALIAAALFRLVTTLGDVVCLAIGWRLGPSRPAARHSAP